MNVPHPQIYCPNLNCTAPLNDFGHVVCASCQTPLLYRYLWATGTSIEWAVVGSTVGGRYYVKTPQIWLDTQPALLPDFPRLDLSEEMLAYLYLYAYQLHVPEVYGVCTKPQVQGARNQESREQERREQGAEKTQWPKTQEGDNLETEEASGVDILLLENVPLDANGNLYPAISQVWAQTTPVRQVYWLWQLLQLWGPFSEQGVSSSLLAVDNIRVEGWRVRLCQLFQDERVLQTMDQAASELPVLGLADLANVWLEWVHQTDSAIAEPLQAICHAMQAQDAQLGPISQRLNQLLLEQVATLPLRLDMAGMSDVGPTHEHNEDTCYPLNQINQSGPFAIEDGVFPRLAIVCDGIGGHEGGEVASQMAVQSLKLQVQALLAEVQNQDEPFSPEVVTEQLEAISRVINDLISNQNDLQGREARRRMGTTLVMALQLPQRIQLPDGSRANSHELYLVNVGDSRAYWLTPQSCHRLTIDDDVAVREVRMGRFPYREALRRPDAGALTQAIGTRDSEFLRPLVQRFILEEDGVLLLCSDGLSDNGLVETAWSNIMRDVFQGIRSLETATQGWIDLANQKNGHDNVSVVLLQCQVSSPALQESMPATQTVPSDWAMSSRGLLVESATDYEAIEPSEQPEMKLLQPARRPSGWLILGLLGIWFLGMGVGLTIWAQFNPTGFQQLRERILPSSNQEPKE